MENLLFKLELDIERLAQKRFDEIYTIEDILKGDTVEMMAKCNKWVVETYHREALISFMMMEAIAIEGRSEIEQMECDITDHVYAEYDELSACMELERLLT